MAIYKPSNCQPFLNSIDLTTDQYLQCEVNTSNMKATGYKIRITSSNLNKNANNIIFEGKTYTRVSSISGNTGLNGSIFQAKMITTTLSEAVANPNMIYCKNVKNADGTVTSTYYHYPTSSSSGVVIPNFFNGYQNQPYRWQITFAQGQEDTTDTSGFTQSPNIKWYDMIITTGTVMGSTGNRIQTYPSKEVRSDYYIQLYDSSNKTIGERQLILRKDSSFGYIYPRENQYTLEEIRQANYYQVFKDTNDINAVDPNRAVMYLGVIPTTSLANNWGRRLLGLDNQPTTSVTGWTITSLDKKSAVNDYYIVQRLSPPNTEAQYLDLAPVSPSISWFTGNATQSAFVTAGADSFLFVAEPDNNNNTNWESTSYNGSPFNGIYEFVDISWDKDFNNYIIRWQRPSQARKIAQFINQQWFVQDTLLNYTVPTLQTGVATEINTTALKFTVEQAIDLYGTNSDYYYGNDKTKGHIFKNNSNGGVITTYIRPFTGLQSGMGFQYYDANNNLIQITDFKLSQEDKNGFNRWNITYAKNSNQNANQVIPTVLTPEETSYKIISYFKTSDENPFYAYATPSILLAFATNMRAEEQLNSEGKMVPLPDYYPDPDTGEEIPARGSYEADIEVGPDGKITVSQNGITPPEKDHYPWIVPFRFVNLYGSYEQSQNKSWRNFTWSLFDYNLNTSRLLDTQYSGDITAFFDGLQNGHKYQVTLTIEDELGAVLSKSLDFQCILPDNLNEGYFPLEVEFDCATQSVDINFIKNGIVVPNYYRNNQGKLEQNTSMLTPLMNERGVSIPDGPYYKNNRVLAVRPDSLTFEVPSPNDPTQSMKVFAVRYATNSNSGTLPFGLQYAYTKTPVQQQGSTQVDPIGLLSGPQQNSVTFNSQHKLNEYFEGTIFHHEIDLYPDETYFDTKVGIRVDLGPSSLTDETTGVVTFNPNRNFLQGLYTQIETTDGWQSGNQNTSYMSSVNVVIYGAINGEQSSNQWRIGQLLMWSYLPQGVNPNDNYDYLPTTYVYDWKQLLTNGLIQTPDDVTVTTASEGISGIVTEHYYVPTITYLSPNDINSSQEMVWPMGAPVTNDSGLTAAVWWDTPLSVATLADGTTKVNVRNTATTERTWSDSQAGQWSDKRGITIFFTVYDANATNNHTGRQTIANKWLLFNVAMDNFDPKERLASETVVNTIQCYFGTENINKEQS